MCGRYALALPPSAVRRRLQESNMPADDDLDDDDTRQSYNFAPGYYGLVYRADAPDHGAASQHTQQEISGEQAQEEHTSSGERADEQASGEQAPEEDDSSQKTTENTESTPKSGHYKLQAMKWGLVPFWTKRNPDYGTTMKTINCRDDSLATPGGMWTTMKQKKRCIVIAEGFYEWLKKNGGKEKIPHYVKRKDGQLMCFAGLWDCVQYEDSPNKLYTYTIITTDSNPQLSFLHDRMPVILDPGSPAIFTWLDATTSTWTKTLQALLKPFKGELEIYPVVKDVGKVGNNSPTFVVPVDSAQNKQNIANFFGNQRRAAKTKEEEKEAEGEAEEAEDLGAEIKQDPAESRKTVDGIQDSENNAPKPIAVGSKRQREDDDNDDNADENNLSKKAPKLSTNSSPAKKASTPISSKKSKSATSNHTFASKVSPTKAGDGSKKITAFFGK